MCQGCFPLEYWKKEKPVSSLLAFFPLGCFSCPQGICNCLFHFFFPFSLFLVCSNLATFLPSHSDLEPHFPFSWPIAQESTPAHGLLHKLSCFISQQMKENWIREPITGPALQVAVFLSFSVFNLHCSQELGLKHKRWFISSNVLYREEILWTATAAGENVSLATPMDSCQGKPKPGCSWMEVQGMKESFSKVSHLLLCSVSLLRCW